MGLLTGLNLTFYPKSVLGWRMKSSSRGASENQSMVHLYPSLRLSHKKCTNHATRMPYKHSSIALRAYPLLRQSGLVRVADPVVVELFASTLFSLFVFLPFFALQQSQSR